MNIETKTLKRRVSKIEKYKFLDGLYQFNLQSNFLVPALGLFGGAGYSLYANNILLATSAALTAIIPMTPFFKKYKQKMEYGKNLIPNEVNKTEEIDGVVIPKYIYKKDKKNPKKRIIQYDANNEPLVEKNSFCVQLGWHIKEHKRTTMDSVKESNLIKPLLMETEKWCRHGIICGTTGSGKTVYLQYIVKQLMDQGAGCMFINGKPDTEMKKEMFALCALVGREQDFYYLDFAQPKKSMSISVFDVSSEGVDELFKFMLGEKGDNEWGQKALNLMSSLLKLFMELKKHNLVFPHSEIKNINNLQDLLDLKHTYTMGFYIIDSYMTSNNLLNLLKLFHKLYSNKETKRFLDKITGNNQIETLKQKPIHADLISSMEKLTNFDYETLVAKTFEELLKLKDDPFYSVGIAIDYWSEILKKFTSDYENILDNTSPQININDILRGHKFLYVSLPGTSSKNNLGLLGKMMVAQIKSAYEKIQSSSPLEVPFTVFSDEFNSWSKGLEGFGDLISQTRSKRLAFYFLYQSSLKSMDDGKLLEGMQILGNTNNKIILKVEEQSLVEEVVKQFGKEELAEDNDSYVKRNFDDNDKTSLEKTLTNKEYDKVTQDEIRNLEPGQCFIQLGADFYKAVSGYLEPTRYETSDSSGDVPFEERYNKERFINEFEKYLSKSNSIEL